MIAALMSFLAGVVLGQRFKVIILIPASAVVISGATLVAVFASTGARVGLSVGLLSWCALQMGYFVGLAVKVILIGDTAVHGQHATLRRPAADVWHPKA
jgi:hypothetical protein